MDPIKYFEDLTRELQAVQNRIRNLIGDAHWPSDGAWKESVLRTIIRRYLPPSFTVGSGFILTPAGLSTQVDILVCDDSAPIFFRDGDFLITPSDCVRAAVEVKTKLAPGSLREAFSKLNSISELTRVRPGNYGPPFLGLFCYDPVSTKPADVLDLLNETNGQTHTYEISSICLGPEHFIRYWEFEPGFKFGTPYNTWHAYNLPAIAPGYFIHNLVEAVFPGAVERAEGMWYPGKGKEQYIVASKRKGVLETKQPKPPQA